MKFSIVLALLPLALAAPGTAPEAAAAAAKQPCCSDCDTTLYKACRDSCWDRGYFSYCTYQCVMDSNNCLANCNKSCKA
ncbi:hypothetical protein BBK36DRAFT_1162118 [Trichoderma citrinoviride]|uniref:Uncharacterized protein n=1 Tax=Trichoderma citrinoviride TaxID=58853 RepID=A0A2T4B254_9HYPO|nr:hypothetical protein BBK36DRAFT_1162118 [Trichoderma citrinoviride]PTB63402.1 hypothetical protein BBK36DRAFT_1162118 [Trichoderma citrinoviride]